MLIKCARYHVEDDGYKERCKYLSTRTSEMLYHYLRAACIELVRAFDHIFLP